MIFYYILLLFPASDMVRTEECAKACLFGLFPTNDDEIWDKNDASQSIPIYKVPKQSDYILFPSDDCDRYERAFYAYIQSPVFKAYMAQHKELFRRLQKLSGMKIKTFHDAKELYDILCIEKLNNKT